MTTQRLLFATFLLAATACGSDSNPTVRCAGGICECVDVDCFCPPGRTCVSVISAADVVCEGDCDVTCTASGCDVFCEPGSTCAIDCAGSECDAHCRAESSCSVECSGDDCDVWCEGGADCTAVLSGPDPVLNCALGSVCTGTCTASALECDVVCDGAACTQTCENQSGGICDLACRAATSCVQFCQGDADCDYSCEGLGCDA